MIRFPTDRQRLAIVGRTGTGKTVAAAWHLSRRSFDVMPWVIYDFKGDELLNEISGARHIELSELPVHPGVYIVHPLPDDTEGIAAHMERIWRQGSTGVYIDEGYMVDGPWFRALLTQGRSKQIPMIVLAQRPVWISRFLFSESDFFQVFHLNHLQDRKKVSEFVPADLDRMLPEYHSYWYDVGNNEVHVLKPVPGKAEILNTFNRRLEAMARKNPERIFI